MSDTKRMLLIQQIVHGVLGVADLNKAWRHLGWDTKGEDEIASELASVRQSSAIALRDLQS